LPSPILAPVIALVLWTFVMGVWLYATRIPALKKHQITYDPQRPAEEFHAQLPAAVRWKADNHNNLLEQPTLFLCGGADAGVRRRRLWFQRRIGLGYVALRIVHSLVHALINKVMIRFALYALASLVLLVMTIRAALIVFLA